MVDVRVVLKQICVNASGDTIAVRRQIILDGAELN